MPKIGSTSVSGPQPPRAGRILFEVHGDNHAIERVDAASSGSIIASGDGRSEQLVATGAMVRPTKNSAERAIQKEECLLTPIRETSLLLDLV
jgi:hypothetical protein